MDRPVHRVFLGYSFTAETDAKIRVPQKTCRKIRDKLKELLRQGGGRNLGRLILEQLNPLLRGWMNYFLLSETKGVCRGTGPMGEAAPASNHLATVEAPGDAVRKTEEARTRRSPGRWCGRLAGRNPLEPIRSPIGFSLARMGAWPDVVSSAGGIW